MTFSLSQYKILSLKSDELHVPFSHPPPSFQYLIFSQLILLLFHSFLYSLPKTFGKTTTKLEVANVLFHPFLLFLLVCLWSWITHFRLFSFSKKEPLIGAGFHIRRKKNGRSFIPNAPILYSFFSSCSVPSSQSEAKSGMVSLSQQLITKPFKLSSTS